MKKPRLGKRAIPAVRRALDAESGNVTAAARRLKVSRGALLRCIAREELSGFVKELRDQAARWLISGSETRRRIVADERARLLRDLPKLSVAEIRMAEAVIFHTLANEAELAHQVRRARARIG